MNAGSTQLRTTLTNDDRLGLRRSKPLTTSLKSTEPTVNTHLTRNVTIGAKPAQTQHDRLVKQTQTWVAQTFFGTLMKQMRDSPFKSDLFEGGRGGQAFQSLYDQQLSERMARGAGAKLVNSIVHRMEARAAAVKDKVKPFSPAARGRFPVHPQQPSAERAGE
jgi:Rod binding domain-containing protein